MDTDSKAAISGGNRTAILDAAVAVFLRFGYRKASMDNIARAAGLSRQSVYVNFDTKEDLFRAVVLHILETTRVAANTALGRTDRDIEERLLAVFETIHAHVIGQIGAEQMSELFENAASLVGPVFQDLEDSLITGIASLLASSGSAAAWNRASISAQDLAQNLYSVSYGLRHRVRTIEAYRNAMGMALRMVCRGCAKAKQPVTPIRSRKTRRLRLRR